MSAPYYVDSAASVYRGDCVDVMRALPACSVDAVVTDPPYGIRFMGEAWDAPRITRRAERGRATSPMPPGLGGPHGGYRSEATEAGRYNRTLAASLAFQEWCTEWASECMRVLKPGGHLLAFGGSRTWHRLTAGIEDAGFEIRDSIAWLYASGFPKNVNVGAATGSRVWNGWGTALKPAFEPCVVARKPLCGTVAANVLAHGVGAIHVDACRVPMSEGDARAIRSSSGVGEEGAVRKRGTSLNLSRTESFRTIPYKPHADGRWPTNVVLDEEAVRALDAEHDDQDGPSRFFPVFHYESKAPASERPTVDGVSHPTVKPLELMRWLVRLTTPHGGTVLDPFAGSGTTLEAAIREGMRVIGVEREESYLPLIMSRLARDIDIPLFI